MDPITLLHPLDAHNCATRMANFMTYLRFDEHGPYEPGTPAHSYWLEKFDEVLARRYGQRAANG